MQQLMLNRKYKDRLFRLIFRDKKEMLALYNAINKSSYDDPDALEITTLDDVIYMSMKNDVSFLLGDVLNLWEHQSSYNPNMPIRGLFYFSRLYREFIEQNKINIYSSTLKKIPYPQYIVFYNGLRDEPDRVELKLSDMYYAGPAAQSAETIGPCLEVKATMININLGKNPELMEQCRSLKEYAIFVEKVREFLKAGTLVEEAVNKAIDDCIRNEILADILSMHRTEVIALFMTEYDEQAHMDMVGEENFAAGKAKGKAEGKAEAICVMLEDICEIPEKVRNRILSEMDLAVLDRWLKVVRRSGSLEEFLEKSGLEI